MRKANRAMLNLVPREPESVRGKKRESRGKLGALYVSCASRGVGAERPMPRSKRSAVGGMHQIELNRLF